MIAIKILPEKETGLFYAKVTYVPNEDGAAACAASSSSSSSSTSSSANQQLKQLPDALNFIIREITRFESPRVYKIVFCGFDPASLIDYFRPNSPIRFDKLKGLFFENSTITELKVIHDGNLSDIEVKRLTDRWRDNCLNLMPSLFYVSVCRDDSGNAPFLWLPMISLHAIHRLSLLVQRHIMDLTLAKASHSRLGKDSPISLLSQQVPIAISCLCGPDRATFVGNSNTDNPLMKLTIAVMNHAPVDKIKGLLREFIESEHVTFEKQWYLDHPIPKNYELMHFLPMPKPSFPVGTLMDLVIVNFIYATDPNIKHQFQEIINLFQTYGIRATIPPHDQFNLLEKLHEEAAEFLHRPEIASKETCAATRAILKNGSSLSEVNDLPGLGRFYFSNIELRQCNLFSDRNIPIKNIFQLLALLKIYRSCLCTSLAKAFSMCCEFFGSNIVDYLPKFTATDMRSALAPAINKSLLNQIKFSPESWMSILVLNRLLFATHNEPQALQDIINSMDSMAVNTMPKESQQALSGLLRCNIWQEYDYFLEFKPKLLVSACRLAARLEENPKLQNRLSDLSGKILSCCAVGRKHHVFFTDKEKIDPTNIKKLLAGFKELQAIAAETSTLSTSQASSSSEPIEQSSSRTGLHHRTLRHCNDNFETPSVGSSSNTQRNIELKLLQH